MREEVKKFSEAMEERLVENEFRGGWSDTPPKDLLIRMMDNVEKARSGVIYLGIRLNREASNHWVFALSYEEARVLKRHLVDIGNYAMMLNDQVEKHSESL